MAETESTQVLVGSAKPAPSAQVNQGKLIQTSGCSDIQEALAMGRKYGLKADDLHPETAQEVVNVMAAAKEVGGQAAPKPSSEQEK